MHVSTLVDNRFNPNVSRLFTWPWTGAAWPWTRADNFQNDLTHMKVVLKMTGDTLTIDDLHFDTSGASPIDGTPKKLEEEWQRKVALKLDDGKIVPKWSLPEAEPEARRDG
jgi:hypothetical protein